MINEKQKMSNKKMVRRVTTGFGPILDEDENMRMEIYKLNIYLYKYTVWMSFVRKVRKIKAILFFHLHKGKTINRERISLLQNLSEEI